MTVQKIYFDMDGVLADFDRGTLELCHVQSYSQNGACDPQYDDMMWDAVRKVDHFYDRLELMPGAKEMFDAIYARYGDRCEILTGIPKPERGIVTAAEDKVNWVHRLLSDWITVHAVCRKHKVDYCKGPDCILIDDREKTIQEWREAGGTGILHTTSHATIEALESLGLL